jgi:hypothetical protein
MNLQGEMIKVLPLREDNIVRNAGYYAFREEVQAHEHGGANGRYKARHACSRFLRKSAGTGCGEYVKIITD